MLSRQVALSRVAFVFAGLIFFVPLVDCATCFPADPPAAQPKPKRALPPRPPLLPNSLIGRITDEKGAPVADAEIQMYSKDGGPAYMRKTKADGSYAFPRMPSAAVYHLSIYSTRCVGLTDYRDDKLDIPLDPPKTVTRDFVLKLACQLHLTVVDEDGRPVPKVMIYKPGRQGGPFRRTNAQGQITIGLAPSSLPSRFALHHDDFAFEFLDVKLDDPSTIVERKVTLSEGKAVRGTVTCSDGKPAFGCRILALPSWWDFLSYPHGQPIQADGSFEFKHIGPGTYKISVSVPQGAHSSTSRDYLSDVDLFNRKDPLAIKVDFPSPAAMGFIEGRIRFKGDRRPKQGFWINASSPAAGPLTGGQYVQRDDKTFKLGPLPVGRYLLSVESAEIEAKSLGALAVGTKNVELELTVRGPMILKGLIAGDGDNQPLKNLRIRLFKTQYLRGPNYTPDEGWQPVGDTRGAFTAEIPGPGVYVVEASADGYAIGKSEPANSDTDLNKELRIKLSRGLSLNGMVVDEAGRPINGATVVARSQFGTFLPVSAAKLPSEAGVPTTDGRFLFEHLSPGKETLRALHPDYAFADVKDLELSSGRAPAPVTITMKRGGTVRGRVYDQNGRPAPGVPLRFRNIPHDDYRGIGELASGVSDDAGEFEVAHLPESVVYVTRANGWNALGVVSQMVFPKSGKIARVDFGGVKKVTGRLLVNGKPLADTKVMLSGEQPFPETVRAFAMTDGEGNFVFRGIPPGERFLYYPIIAQRSQRWVRVKSLQIVTSNDAFGTIEVVTATLTVHCPGADPKNREINVWLQEYDPVRFSRGYAINPDIRHSENDPFVFRDVPNGKYALSLNRREKLGLRQVIDMTGTQDKSVTLAVPKGTASLRGTVKLLASEPRIYLQVRSKDNRLVGGTQVKSDGTFEIDELPAGDYILTQGFGVQADALASFSVAEGEHKSISLSEPRSSFAKGLFAVRPYTADGLPIPGCQVTLTGPKGEVAELARQPDFVSFSADPGPYRLSVTYPGFAPVNQQVDVKPAKNGHWGLEHELNVMLTRSTELAKPELH